SRNGRPSTSRRKIRRSRCRTSRTTASTAITPSTVTTAEVTGGLLTVTLPPASSMRASTGAPPARCIRYADGLISTRTGRLILTLLVFVRDATTTAATDTAPARQTA